MGCLQKNFFKDSHNLHIETNTKVDAKIRIKEEQVDPFKTRQIERSLRTIVKAKMKQMGMTEQQKVTSSLTAGP